VFTEEIFIQEELAIYYGGRSLENCKNGVGEDGCFA
jgi:hypothetical protein